MEWKWTLGEPYERSRRRQPTVQEEESPEKLDHQFTKEIEQSAYTTSLHHDENTWDILNQSLYDQGFRQSNKRELLDDKIANRDLVQQIGFNPFLTNQSNYGDDIAVREQYLKPISTTQEREKTTDSGS